MIRVYPRSALDLAKDAGRYVVLVVRSAVKP